jgi:hypothetical protein
LQLGDLGSDRFKHADNIFRYVGIPKANDCHTTLTETGLSRGILCFCLGMLATIELDHKPHCRRVKIQDERPRRMLAAKIDAKLPVSQLLPQPHFDIR